MTAVVSPARLRSTMAEETGIVRVTIPARRNWLLVGVLCAWLCGWSMGEMMAVRAVFGAPSGPRPPPTAFLALWLVGWTAGGAWAMYSLIWLVLGREIVELDGRSLALRREPMGIPPRKQYDVLHVRNLRVVPFDGSVWAKSDPFVGMRSGPLAFDYGAKTIRFGSGVDEAEARVILASIRTRFPELAT